MRAALQKNIWRYCSGHELTMCAYCPDGQVGSWASSNIVWTSQVDKRLKQVIHSLCSTLLRSNLGCCPALESSAQERHEPVAVHPRPATLIFCEEKLTEFGLFSLRKRRLQQNFTAVFQYSEGAYKKDRDNIFVQTCSAKTRGNGLKPKDGGLTSKTRKNFITVRMLKHLSRLLREMVDALPLVTLKVRLDGTLGNLISSPLTAEGLSKTTFKGLFKPKE